MKDKLKIAAIPGSLRKSSSTTFILQHIIKLFPEAIDFILYEGASKLPHFDDSETVSNEVTSFRKLLQDADGIIICQPEYAFGVAGSLKNALDWTVSSGELVNKPVALITAATGGDKAHAAMLWTLKALSSKVDDAALLIPFVRTKLNDKGEVINAETERAITDVLTALINIIRKVREQ
ncbi:MAG: NAD(P)H-dependent oxidoreductase [Bacteroidota bacterium]|nr:NAD(P)H-dependent oxidoreductase [Bacteroidota bacterium]